MTFCEYSWARINSMYWIFLYIMAVCIVSFLVVDYPDPVCLLSTDFVSRVYRFWLTSFLTSKWDFNVSGQTESFRVLFTVQKRPYFTALTNDENREILTITSFVACKSGLGHDYSKFEPEKLCLRLLLTCTDKQHSCESIVFLQTYLYIRKSSIWHSITIRKYQSNTWVGFSV